MEIATTKPLPLRRSIAEGKAFPAPSLRSLIPNTYQAFALSFPLLLPLRLLSPSLVSCFFLLGREASGVDCFNFLLVGLGPGETERSRRTT